VVSVDDINLRNDSQDSWLGVMQLSAAAWRCPIFIRWSVSTLTTTLSRWQHH